MKRNDLLKTICLMVIIVGLTVGSSILLNLHTGPIIEANSTGAVLEQLKGVMPDAVGFEELYNDADPSKSKLTVQPTAFVYEGTKADCTDGTSGKVLSIYKETSEPSLGYVFRITVTTGYSTKPMEYTVAVSAEGIITAINTDVYTESKPVDGFADSFVGQDSALGGVSLVAGVTYTSKGVKLAMEQTMNLLVANEFFAAGEVTDADLALSLVNTVFPGYVKAEDLEVTGNITKAFKAGASKDATTVSYGYVMTIVKEEVTYLAVASVSGNVSLYQFVKTVTDTEETYSLVASTDADVIAEASAFVTALPTTFAKLSTKLNVLFPGATIEEVAVKNAGVITAAAVVTTAEGVKYYAYHGSPVNNFAGDIMSVYVVLDSEGKIYKTLADEYAFGHYEFDPYLKNFDANVYSQGFVGWTKDTYNTEEVFFTGATHTNTSMNNCVVGAFAEFSQGGNN